MDPQAGRIAFNLAILLLVLAIIPLPILRKDSAEFVVDLIALIVSLTFLLLVIWEIRKQIGVVKDKRSEKLGKSIRFSTPSDFLRPF
ncbi:MAG: hypothetical protein QXL85_08155 [Candidatus Bathyarchaeia archaeon]